MIERISLLSSRYPTSCLFGRMGLRNLQGPLLSEYTLFVIACSKIIIIMSLVYGFNLPVHCVSYLRFFHLYLFTKPAEDTQYNISDALFTSKK